MAPSVGTIPVHGWAERHNTVDPVRVGDGKPESDQCAERMRADHDRGSMIPNSSSIERIAAT